MDQIADDSALRPTRRGVVREGLKLAFVAPAISSFFAREAYAASYSCYPVGHVCVPPGQNTGEHCCPGLQCVRFGRLGICKAPGRP